MYISDETFMKFFQTKIIDDIIKIMITGYAVNLIIKHFQNGPDVSDVKGVYVKNGKFSYEFISDLIPQDQDPNYARDDYDYIKRKEDLIQLYVSSKSWH